MTHAEVRAKAEDVLRALKYCRTTLKNDLGSVNWADLSIVQVLWCVDEEGEERWTVEIEEAEPGAALGSYVATKLDEAGITADVRCEW